jgi:predicted kinase
MKVVVMMGIPGSGKTTWIGNNLDYEEFPHVVSLDDIRERLNGDAAVQANMDEVVEIAHARLKWLLLHGKNAVWDATNLVHEHRMQILETCERFAANTELVIMEDSANFDLCRERNAARDRVVPNRAMERMDRQFYKDASKIHEEGWDKILPV